MNENVGESKLWVLRLFSCSWALIFAVLGIWQSEVSPPFVGVLSYIVACSFSVGLFIPAVMRYPYYLVERLFAPVGQLMATLILGIVYFSIFTLFALVFRLRKRQPLCLHRARWPDSAWVTRPESPGGDNYHWQY